LGVQSVRIHAVVVLRIAGAGVAVAGGVDERRTRAGSPRHVVMKSWIQAACVASSTLEVASPKPLTSLGVSELPC
jgi:hypothetical protein